MIFIFENQFNVEFWDANGACGEVVRHPDSILHWLSRYRGSVPRLPGHVWVRDYAKTYQRVLLVGAIDNTSQLGEFYGLKSCEFIYFPFVDECELWSFDLSEVVKAVPIENSVLILTAIASPKQDIIALRLSRMLPCENVDVACAGYALTSEFMRVPRSLLMFSSRIGLEWMVHSIFNHRRFLSKMRHYFS